MGDTTVTPADRQAHIDANGADVQAAQDRLWETQQQSLEQQRADIQGGFWSQLGLHKADQDHTNALMFFGEWEKAVNGDIETSVPRADGSIPAPQVSSGVGYGSVFNNDAKDKEDNWEAIGNIFGNGSGG